jgi:hypothetical protein
MKRLNKKPIQKTYICPICDRERESYNKTEILCGKRWVMGCQDCFIRSIEEPDKESCQPAFAQI